MNMMKKELLVDSDKYSTLVKIDEDTRDEVEGLWEEWSGWDVKKRKRRLVVLSHAASIRQP